MIKLAGYSLEQKNLQSNQFGADLHSKTYCNIELEHKKCNAKAVLYLWKEGIQSAKEIKARKNVPLTIIYRLPRSTLIRLAGLFSSPAKNEKIFFSSKNVDDQEWTKVVERNVKLSHLSPDFQSISSSNTRTPLKEQYTKFNTPNIPLTLLVLLLITFQFTVIYHPYPAPRWIENIREIIGETMMNISLLILFTFHSIETLVVAWVLWKREESNGWTWVTWCSCTFLIGGPCVFEILRNRDEDEKKNEKEKKIE
ncbi:hypothetical protein G9A89_001275 [Geosiphon pyriformis]|nr:hypothetical protein G9A89_001275 [Geosiphon pyriformis]